MNRRCTALLLVVVFATGTTAFTTGRLIAARRQGQSGPIPEDWLRGAPAEVRQSDRQFQQRARSLMDIVASEKGRLAAMLRDTGVTEQEILAQVDRVIASHTLLTNSVGEHLVELRGQLPQRQRQHLMTSCRNLLQRQVQRRYRWRGGSQGDMASQGRGYGYGGEPRPGEQGRGRRYRGGRGGAGNELSRRLDLTEEQALAAQNRDPNFAPDTAILKDRMGRACADLLAGFEDAAVDNESLLARVRELTEAHNALEKRVAEHVICIRPDLSARQRDTLAELVEATRMTDPNGPVSSDVSSTGLLSSGGQADALTALLDRL